MLDLTCLNLHTGDPDGWDTLSPLIILGKLFDSHNVQVTFSFSLAKPVILTMTSYAIQLTVMQADYGRGTTIPLWLTVTGANEQALDLLSSPKKINLLLLRALATRYNATNGTDHHMYNCFYENVARAVFWGQEDYKASGQRILQGEVDAKRSLKQSTLSPRFAISYHLAFQPFEAVGFIPIAPKDTPLLRQNVTIASVPAQGIPARSHAPPECVQEQGADYNKSVGLLENGNQPFYHHGHGGFS